MEDDAQNVDSHILTELKIEALILEGLIDDGHLLMIRIDRLIEFNKERIEEQIRKSTPLPPGP